MWPFKRKQESPQEIAAEKKLDEATREVAWDEFGKEAVREQQGGFFGPLKLSFRREKPDPLHHVEGDPVPEPVDDSDPGTSAACATPLAATRRTRRAEA